MEHQANHQVEVVTFCRGDEFATVVTDGVMTRSFRREDTQQHESLKRAIAYLEARGYQIIPDAFSL